MRKLIVAAALGIAIGGCSAGQDKAIGKAASPGSTRCSTPAAITTFTPARRNEFRQAGSEQAATRFLAMVHDRLGPVRRADQRGWRVNFATGGTMVSLSYSTEFASGRGTEDFVFRVRGGSPVLVGYHINSMDLIGAPPPRSLSASRLDVEADRKRGTRPSFQTLKRNKQDVAVLDDIVLALGAHPARLLGAGLAAVADEILIGDGLGADEAALEIGVDDAGGLGRLGAFLDRPGARFLGAGGEEGDQMEQVVAGADDAGEAGLGRGRDRGGTRSGPPAAWSRSRPRSRPR